MYFVWVTFTFKKVYFPLHFSGFDLKYHLDIPQKSIVQVFSLKKNPPCTGIEPAFEGLDRIILLSHADYGDHTLRSLRYERNRYLLVCTLPENQDSVSSALQLSTKLFGK